MSIVLIGYRGSGKTTVGRRLAERLGWRFVDSDEQLVTRAGKSIKDIFAQDGEPAFRELEAAVVVDVLSQRDQVISLGGGAVMRPENREAIRAAKYPVIYLRCEPQILYERIHADPATAANRPALTPLAGGIEEIRHLLAMREPSYREAMTIELDVTHLSPDETVERIVKSL